MAKSAREIRQEAAKARLAAAQHEDANAETVTLSALAKARQRSVRANDNSAMDAEDEVRLYEDGWKERYFRTKFDVSADDTEFRRKVVASYVEGLAWVLSYYYQGFYSLKYILFLYFIFQTRRPRLELVLSVSLCALCLGFHRFDGNRN